jgi:hypothetical protein
VIKKTVEKNMSLRSQQKKTVAKNIGNKSASAKKTGKKKAPCHETVRLQLGWCLLDVVATW